MNDFDLNDYINYMNKASQAYFAYKEFCNIIDTAEKLKDVFGEENVGIDENFNITVKTTQCN